MRLLDRLLTWRPARPGDTPGQCEPDDAPAQDIDARRRAGVRCRAVRVDPNLTYPWGWVTCLHCGRPAGIGIYHHCRGGQP